jgi:hypothetical protein
MQTFELLIDELEASTLEVDAVALVDEPAIESNWFAFKDTPNLMQFAQVSNEEQIIVGAAMIPDKPIFRRDEDGKEYNITFSKQTVQAIALKFFKKKFQSNANIQHDPTQKKDGVTFFLSFIKDTSKGMVGLAGEYPEGTWFLGAKVDNEEVWAKVKSGEIKGFSVEGMFKYKKTALTDEQKFEEVVKILSGITE